LSQYLQNREATPQKRNAASEEVQVQFFNKKGKSHKPSRKQTSGSVVSSNPEHTAFSTDLFSSLPKGKNKMMA